jgi:DNA-directed RNA polymerase subunit H (RpoH/RPB5)
MEARVARAICVVKEMLIDRGIGLGELETVGDDEIRHLTASRDFFHLAADDRDVIVITRKLKTQDLQKAAAALDEARRERAIILSVDKPGFVHRNAVEAHYGPRAETFSLAELQFNVTRHELVPRHVRLADAEVKALLKTYMLSDKRLLPAIHSTDPVAKYLGLAPGDVVRVSRPSPSAGTTDFYRTCVKLAEA